MNSEIENSTTTAVLFWDMFYLGNPHRYMYEYEAIVNAPLIYAQAWPYFLALMALENGLRLWQRREMFRLNDSITSMSNAILQECAKVMYRGSEHYIYTSIYSNYKCFQLPWDSVIFWYSAAVAVDFCYYWMHRASHEIHIFWAQHQVHHSSEEFNVTVGVRQSVFQSLIATMCYAPLALFVPPVLLLVHQQLNLLYQIWIHTETIPTLGPLDYILNTPSHHRVHHGSDLYCLDKNYGGVLIIWDRMFGTFQDYAPDETITYGLVYQKNSFNPLYLQFFYNLNVYYKWNATGGWQNKLRSIVRGPSWMPGLSWTGREGRRAIVTGLRKKYDVHLSFTFKLYLLIHFVAVVHCYLTLVTSPVPREEITITCTTTILFYIVWSLTNIGLIFDKSSWANHCEFLRCLLVSVILTSLESSPCGLFNMNTINAYQMLMGVSIVFWATKYCFIR